MENFGGGTIEQTLLQDAEVGNSSEDDIKQYLELPASVTTHSGRVSRSPEQLQDFFCGEINEPIIDEQTKNNGTVSPGIDSPAVCEIAFPLDNLSRLLTALGGPNQREIRSFVSTPAAEKVLHQVSQLSNRDIEKMLMDILDEETTSGLNEEELLAETVSSTLSASKPPVAALPQKDMVNTMSLTATVDIISEVNATQIEPATVCKITVEEPCTFDIRADRIKSVARIPALR